MLGKYLLLCCTGLLNICNYVYFMFVFFVYYYFCNDLKLYYIITAANTFTAMPIYCLYFSKPELPGFPHIMELKKIFPSEDCEKHIDWKQEAETFPRFCHLISLPTFTYNVMLGFLISMGTITQRLVSFAVNKLKIKLEMCI